MRQSTAILSVLLIVVALASGLVLGASNATQQQSNQTQTHTLEIAPTNGSATGSYTVSASGNTTIKNGESGDAQQRGGRIAGSVGNGDAKDVIQYQGRITSIQADESIQVTLNGRQIAPAVLGGQHLRINRSEDASTPIRYNISVSGQASHGEQAEKGDKLSSTTIQGEIRGKDKADSFYFNGDLNNDSISVSGEAQIQINGQNASVYLSNPPPTPPSPTASPNSPSVSATASSTSTSPESTAKTQPTTATPHSPTAASPAATNNGGESGTNSGGSGIFDLIVPIISGIAAVGVMLFILFKET